MSTPLEKERATLTKEEGKLKKVFAEIKKFFAKEFLWVLFVLLLALPISLIITYVMETYLSEAIKTDIDDLLDGIPPGVVAYAISLAGIYFTRAVVAAIKTVTDKSSS